MIGVRVGPEVYGDNTLTQIPTAGNTRPGELLLLSLFMRSINRPGVVTPEGWRLEGAATDLTSTFGDLHVWSRVADGSDLDLPTLMLSDTCNPDGFHCRMVAVTDSSQVVDQNVLAGTTLLRANTPVLNVTDSGSRIYWFAAQIGSDVRKIPAAHNAMEQVFGDHRPDNYRGDVFCYRSRQTSIDLKAWSAAWITGTHEIVQVGVVVK